MNTHTAATAGTYLLFSARRLTADPKLRRFRARLALRAWPLIFLGFALECSAFAQTLPVITTQPVSQHVPAAGNVEFTVAAFDSEPLSFQWLKDGTNLVDGGKISGARTATLTVSNVQGRDMGAYSVMVSNSYGSVTSSNADLRLWPLAAWGYDLFGQTQIPGGLTNVSAVACGKTHMLALRSDGTVAAWGNSGAGRTSPPPDLTNGVAIAAGDFHSLALRGDRTIAAWGSSSGTNVPAGLSNVLAVACGVSHALALRSDGTVVAWGSNSSGQTNVPAGLSNVVAVAAGQAHSLALRNDGSVVGWGSGSYGLTNAPADLGDVVAIACGYLHNLALRSDGTVVSWGSSGYGQTNLPAGLSNVVAISAGGYHSAAIRSDGVPAMWGRGAEGQVSVPAGLQPVVAVVGGERSSLAWEGDGTPFITVLPWSRRMSVGGTARLLLGAVGLQPVSYQWRFNGIDLAGATNALLVLANLQAANAGSYVCVVSNAAGVRVSPEAVLSLTDSPSLTLQPVDQHVLVGGSATFNAAAVGLEPLFYQWRRNGDALPGATNPSVSLQSVGPADAGDYSVLVSNAFGVAISATAHLAVTDSVSLLTLATPWKYNQSGSDLGGSWKEAAYDDAAWPVGSGVLAVEDNALVVPLIQTPLSLVSTSGTRVLTYYFRTRFACTNDPATVSLTFSNLIDDGAVAYLNGIEIYRVRMPAGAVEAATLASNAPEAVFYLTNVDSAALVQGDNVLAVEVHQATATSSDVVFGLALSARATHYATFLAPGLESAVRAALQKPNGAITEQDMLGLIELRIPYQGVSTLAGLEWARNLVLLEASGNPLQDLAPLRALTNLIELHLWDTPLTDASPLVDLVKMRRMNLGASPITNAIEIMPRMPELEFLVLNNNPLYTIAPLALLTNLVELHAWDTRLTDASPVGRLTRLRLLNLGANPITNSLAAVANLVGLQTLNLNYNLLFTAEPLRFLTNLFELHVWDTRLTDASPLQGLTRMRLLNLGANAITNSASVVTNMPSLEWLVLNHNLLFDATPLRLLTNLYELSLWETRITDASPLLGLQRMRRLDLGANVVTNSGAVVSHFPLLERLVLNSNPFYDTTPLRGLTNLTEIQCYDASLTNVSGLRDLCGLRVLNLGHNQISDVAPLSGLTNLTQLWLRENQIRDVSSLEGKVGLLLLDAAINQIGDVRSLSGLTNLTSLNLHGNQVTNASVLSALRKLTFLDFGWSPVGDIGFVSGMTDLTSLVLSGAGIGDLSPLAGLSRIDTLNLWANNISNITVLSGMPRMTWLWLGYNQITDLAPLAGLTQMRGLWLSGNHALSNLTAIRGMTGLTDLEASDCRISDTSQFADFTNLTNLGLWDNPISDLGPLAGLTRLTRLWFGRNLISNIAPLAGMRDLTSLHLPSNPISDASVLTNFTRLTDLEINDTLVADLASFSGLTALTKLWLHDCQVADLTPLTGLLGLRELTLDNNLLTSVDPLLPLTSLGTVSLRNNLLDLNFGTPALGVLQTLQSRGATVNYLPQRIVTLTVQPQSQVVAPGATVSLSVTALGESPLGYQWRKNGGVLADGPKFGGTSTASLVIYDFQLGDVGDYTVIVNNAYGSVTSAVAVMTIAAVSSDPAADFSSSSNPNGAWSAGWSLDPDGPLNLFTVASFDGNGMVWRDPAHTASGAPCFWKNTVSEPRFGVLPNQIALHPGPVNDYAVLQWTAPADGRYTAVIQFFAGDVGDTDGHVFLNAQQLFYAATTVGDPTYAQELCLAARDVIGIAIGSKGNFTSDNTPLRVTITQNAVAGLPTFTSQPQSRVEAVGTSVDFAVVTCGAKPVSCQWRRDGTDLSDGGRISGATTDTLVLADVDYADMGGYSVVVSNAYGAVTSAVAVLTVFGPPGVWVNDLTPASNVVTVTGSAYVELATSLVDGFIFFTLDGSNPAWGWQYEAAFMLTEPVTLRAIVYTPDFLQWAETEPLLIDILRAPTIEQGPVGQTVGAGSAVTLAVEAAGSAPLTYQWFWEGTALSGATNEALVIAGVQASQQGAYSVAVTNVAGAVTSVVAQLTVLVPPTFIQLPESMRVPLGGSVVFAVQAGGAEPIFYQWRKNGVNIAGATNAEFSLTNVLLADGGGYSVVVANEVGAVSSDSVLLLVEVPSQAPPEDSFANRRSLAGTNGYAAGSNLGATRELGEPWHAGKYGTNSVWYAWRAPAGGIVTLRTLGSTFDTLLGIYTNDLSLDPRASISNLVAVAGDEDRGGFLTSQARFNVVENQEYQIAVDGFAGQHGDFILEWELEATADELPVILSGPESQSVPDGAVVWLSVTAVGAGLSYQWYFNGEPITGATGADLVLTNVQSGAVGYYLVAITNSQERGVESLPATVELGPLAGVQSQDKVEDLVHRVGGGSRLWRTRVLGGAVSGPGIVVAAGAVDHQVVNNLYSTTGQGETHCGVICRGTQWLLLRPAADGWLVLDTRGSFDTRQQALATVLALYPGDDAGFYPLCLGCAVTNGSDARFSHTGPVAVTAGGYYYVAADSVDGRAGTIVVNWALGGLPQARPACATNRVVKLGERFMMCVEVMPVLPIAQVQWLFNGVVLQGETNKVLAVSNAQPWHAGEYAVQLSNPLGVAKVVVGKVGVDYTGAALAYSSFDEGIEGWTVSGGATGFMPDATGGRSGGCLSAVDVPGGEPWYWVAPGAYLGDQSGVFGGWLQYDFRQSVSQRDSVTGPAVKLSGGGLWLEYAGFSNPGVEWTTWHVPLYAATGWRQGGGQLVTDADLFRVLRSLTRLEIRGDYASNSVAWLDGVMFVAPCTNAEAVLVIRRLSETTLELTWPVNAGEYLVEAATSLAPANWSTNVMWQDRGVSGCWRRVFVETTGSRGFFRLRQP